MRDRQVFDTCQLANGLTVYHYPDNVPFADIRIIIPFGHVHNCQGVLPGTAHFLEHMTFERSVLYPERQAFSRYVRLNGGSFDASTDLFTTIFEVAVGGGCENEVWRGLVNQVFNPVFDLVDLGCHKQIIASERKRRSRWFPSDDELNHYISTVIMNGPVISLRQNLGEDADLEMMTAAGLQEFHLNYFSRDVVVVAGGNISMEAIVKELEVLPLREIKLPTQYRPSKIVCRNYHVRAFRDVSRYEYHLGASFDDHPTLEVLTAIRFICRYLHNTAHGPVLEWCRNELGSYETKWHTGVNRDTHGWDMFIPLRNLDQVDQVRAELRSRAEKALADDSRVSAEVDRVIKSSVFRYQTLDDILDGAVADLDNFGHIRSEQGYHRRLEHCRDTKFLQQVFKQYFAPEHCGEFCAVPE